MIKDVDIIDSDSFYNLGELIKKDYKKYYNINNILDSEYEDLIGYYIDNKLVAFIHSSKSFDSMDIINIVVDSNYRRKGIANSLLNYLFDKYEDVNNYYLEVRESNIAAINLYKKNSFVVVNIRDNYYGDESAYLMKRGD